MTTTTSRRAILAAAAALPVLAAPVALASFTPDRVFAAIEAHRAAHTERMRCVRIADVVPYTAIPAGAEEASAVASDAEYGAMIDLLNVTPTTLAGVAAVARYAVDHGEENWMDVALDDGSRQSFMESIVLSIADALDAICHTEVQS